MEQSQKRLRQIAAGAVALVLVAVSGWFVLHFGRLEERDISELAVARYRLPVKNDFVSRYEWLSPDKLIVATADKDVNSMLWEFDLRSGERSDLTNVNQFLKDFKGTKGRIVDWSISPEKTLVVCGGRTIRTIVAMDLAGHILSATGTVDGLRIASKPMWLPGRKNWVMTGYTNRVTMGLIWGGGQEVQHVLFHTNSAGPIGVLGQSEIALLQWPPGAGGKWRLARITAGGEVRGGCDIRLPFECHSLQASLSPNGRRILWQFGRSVGFPKLSTSGTFPFVRFTNRRSESSIWVSNSDGTGFVCLGLNTHGYLGDTLKWHPDESKVGAILEEELVLLEIPK